MGLDNLITNIVNEKLNNPILEILKEIKIVTILKQSNFTKKEGFSPYFILMHFVYMIIMNKKISTFIKQSNDSYKKDVYYRLLKNKNFNWRKLLMLSSVKLLALLQKVQTPNSLRVLILDDTVEVKRGKKIEASCDKLWSNNSKKLVKGLNIVSLNYSDGFTNLMLDFALSFGSYAKVKIEDFTNELNYRTNGYKRRKEGLKGKSQIAIDMVKRALNQGIYADYLLVDSWYSKPIFIKEITDEGLAVISRLANNNKIWNFIGKQKTLESIYKQFKKIKTAKIGHYGTIQYTYFSTVVKHRTARKLKIVFITTNNQKLIPIASTDLELSDEEIIKIYKKRWNIEQGYKELREHFGFGKEENRIYEAVIGRITLSFLTYNLVSYVNRIENEPKTIGGLFEDLECQLTALAISMDIFLQILDAIAKLPSSLTGCKDLARIIQILKSSTGSLLGMESENFSNCQ